MRILIALFCVLCLVKELPSQAPLSYDEALKQLYRGYDPVKKTAQWVCTKGQERKGMHAGWLCPKQHAVVSVSVLLEAEVREGSAVRAYVTASARPLKDALGNYECHACLPSIGVAVFEKRAQQWVLESSNAAVGFYGGWGNPPGVDLVEVGPEKHGIVLSTDDIAQGFAWSTKSLLLPIGETVVEAWEIQDENDNLGSIDPDDKENHEVPYRASATFKFLPGDEIAEGTRKYYELEVISRGEDREDYNHPIKPENWTEIYRFRDGKYRLVSHTDIIEPEKRIKPNPTE